MITLYLKNSHTFQSILNNKKTIELRLFTKMFQTIIPYSMIKLQYKIHSIYLFITNIFVFENVKHIPLHILKNIFPHSYTCLNPLDQYYSPSRLKKNKLLGIEFIKPPLLLCH